MRNGLNLKSSTKKHLPSWLPSTPYALWLDGGGRGNTEGRILRPTLDSAQVSPGDGTPMLNRLETKAPNDRFRPGVDPSDSIGVASLGDVPSRPWCPPGLRDRRTSPSARPIVRLALAEDAGDRPKFRGEASQLLLRGRVGVWDVG